MSRTTIEDRNDTIDVARLRPTDGHVLIKIVQREKTGGGIWLVKARNTELCVGEVVTVGPGPSSQKTLRRYPIELVPGDLVFTMGYIGEAMSLRSGEYRFVRDDGIWARARWRDASSLDFASVEPRYARLVVRPESEETTLSGRVLLPNGHDRDSECRFARIVSAGPGVWDADTGKRMPMQVSPGQRVLMVRYAGADVTVNGEKLRICEENDIKTVIEEE